MWCDFRDQWPKRSLFRWSFCRCSKDLRQYLFYIFYGCNSYFGGRNAGHVKKWCDIMSLATEKRPISIFGSIFQAMSIIFTHSDYEILIFRRNVWVKLGILRAVRNQQTLLFWWIQKRSQIKYKWIPLDPGQNCK